MTLLQFVVFILGLGGLVYIGRLFVVDLGFPRSLIEATKPYSCEICKKRYWSSRKAFRCCEETPEWKAWRRAEESRRIRHAKGQHSYRYMERDCPQCNGQPGNYMCPMCEGRGKTFIK